jgi:hypothetical protein
MLKSCPCTCCCIAFVVEFFSICFGRCDQVFQFLKLVNILDFLKDY